MSCLADVLEGRERWRVEDPGDCRYLLGCLPDASVDAIVCDPPYELGFMGAKWDRSGIAFDSAMWTQVLRVAKPGAHLLSFGGTRTWHRIACAIEDGGWQIRDSIAWLFASGFPKSLNISKAIDKKLGAQRPVIGQAKGAGSSDTHSLGAYAPAYAATAAATAAEGIGTALKPAFEPVILARAPIEGAVAETFMRHGTGGLNIDACRIEMSPDDFEDLQAGVEAIRARGGVVEGSWKNSSDLSGANPANPLGRWPANVCFDESQAAALDQQGGDRPGMTGGGVNNPDYAGGIFGRTNARVPEGVHDVSQIGASYLARGDSGGASRFFFCPKASRAERDAGLDEFAAVSGGAATRREDGSAGTHNPRAGSGRNGGSRNTHPTVKPIELMRYLVRLVCPPGGIVLDPFCGSGPTGIAAMLEGRRFVGFDLTPLHVDIARSRIAHVVGGHVPERIVKERIVEPKQPSLFKESA